MARKILTVDEVSAMTGTPAATLRYWRHRGEGPKSWSIGKRVVYYEDDVEAWLEAQYAQAVGGITEAVAG